MNLCLGQVGQSLDESLDDGPDHPTYWSNVLDTARYMRQSLGHPYGGIWTVNPAWTSRWCHVCGERGIRVRDADSATEVSGGEYFYCSSCDIHIHADINAARNLSQSSAVPGRTQLVYPALPT